MLDWDDLRFFLAIVRHGNLSAAARELNVTQPTVGRRLASLESSLGVRLLSRTPDGYVLTLAGQDVRAKAERLETEAHALERTVGGRDTRLQGTVRVTCAETMAAHVLAPCFAALQRQHTDILVELIPDARELSLSMREAELSVRLTQSEQHDLVVRRIGSLAFGLYASREYIGRYGEPELEDGCRGHHVIGQFNDVENAPQFDWLSAATSHARLVFQTNSHEAAVSAALHGAGLACLARFRADHEDALVRLLPGKAAPSTGIWLVVHKDNRDTPRIRAVMTHIATSVGALRGRLFPDGTDDLVPHDGVTDGRVDP
jgi:DNA-binding transcriptional LysR family regulator